MFQRERKNILQRIYEKKRIFRDNILQVLNKAASRKHATRKR